jgi:NitT/TauT family transport system substrate-binding protein
MKAYGIVPPKAAGVNTIGAMSDARWQEFYDTMRDAGVYPPDLDYHAAYTLQFVGDGK